MGNQGTASTGTGTTGARRWDVGEIKARLPMLEVVGACGIVMRRAGAKSKCACPFHAEKSPSFSIEEDHGHCYGCGWHGDIFEFWQAIKGVDFKQAAEDLAGLAGVREVTQMEADRLRRVAHVTPPALMRERERPELPGLRVPNPEECVEIAQRRGLRLRGVQAAAVRGLLWVAEFQGQRAWAIADRERRNVQFRRMDGRRWYDEVKGWSARGSWAAWPVGCTGFGLAERVALVEGGPDALAMCDLLHRWGWGRDACAVAVMFGASSQIAPWCLRRFQGMRVRIFAHHDEEKNGRRAGREAGARWAAQLASVARAVDVVELPDGLALGSGAPVCDVNDALVWEAENVAADELTGGWRF